MTETLEGAAAKAVTRDARRYGLIFVQLGAAHEPMRGTLEGVGDRCQSVSHLLQADSVEPGLIVISDLENASSIHGAEMSKLRALVLDGMDKGGRFVLLSRHPKSRYERVPGSSLLLDARTTLLPIGSVGDADDDSAGVWPACHGGAASVESVALQVFDELGLDVLAALDHVLFESFLDRDSMIDSLSERETEALYGAGLLRRMDGHFEWAIPNRFGEVSNALSLALGATVKPQEELAVLFAELWSLERMLRCHLRGKLEEKLGQAWRATCLHGNLGTKVLGRAREDVYAGAKSLRELRDPLEWLSLGELLEVREKSEVGDLGVEGVVWEKFQREVGPIRNRVSHMRVLRSGDLDAVRQWRAIFDRKLK